jgi:hypothetical protein
VKEAAAVLDSPTPAIVLDVIGAALDKQSIDPRVGCRQIAKHGLRARRIRLVRVVSISRKRATRQTDKTDKTGSWVGFVSFVGCAGIPFFRIEVAQPDQVLVHRKTFGLMAWVIFGRPPRSPVCRAGWLDVIEVDKQIEARLDVLAIGEARPFTALDVPSGEAIK